MRTRNQPGDYRESMNASVQLVVGTVAWAATLALARFGPGSLWDPQQSVASWAAIAVNVIAGVGWIVVFTRFLHRIDELQRRITQDALAVTLGVGWVGGFAYFVADAADRVHFDVNAAALPALLGVTFMVAFFIGKLRYR